MKGLRLIGIGGLLICCSVALALPVSPFNASTPLLTFTKTDLALSAKAKQQVMEAGKPGASAQWQNPKTGRSGTTTLSKIYYKNGKNCRTYRYQVDYKQQENGTFVMSECQQADGRWLFE